MWHFGGARAAPQSRQSPDGAFLKNTKRAVKEQINLLLHRSFYIFCRMASFIGS